MPVHTAYKALFSSGIIYLCILLTCLLDGASATVSNDIYTNQLDRRGQMDTSLLAQRLLQGHELPVPEETTLRVNARNIVFIGSATSSGAASATATSGSPTSNSSSALASASSSSDGSPVYTIATKSESNNLKYLYLIFLVFVVIIVALAIWFVVKRRRDRRKKEDDYIRSEALRLDLQRQGSSNASNQDPRMTQISRIGGDNDEDVIPLPPPSYPEAAHTRNSKLPIYEELDGVTPKTESITPNSPPSIRVPSVPSHLSSSPSDPLNRTHIRGHHGSSGSRGNRFDFEASDYYARQFSHSRSPHQQTQKHIPTVFI